MQIIFHRMDIDLACDIFGDSPVIESGLSKCMIRQLHYLGLLLPLFTTSSWAAEQNSSVHIAPAGSHTAVYGSAENFIGRVRVDPLFNADNDIRVSAAYVTFEPGARSAWHTHPAGQRLIVTSGVGLTQQEEFLQTHLFGDIFARDNLDWQSRELATVGALAATPGVEAQLLSHTRASLRVGLTAAQLRQLAQVLREHGDNDAATRADEALQKALENK